jgi:hypothetical protein
MIKNIELLNKIISDIDQINYERLLNHEDFISEDESNECIRNILKTHFEDILSVDEFQDADFDSQDFLEEHFGDDGWAEIRDAEKGRNNF